MRKEEIKRWSLSLFLICLPLNSSALNIVKVRSFAGAKPVEAVDGMVIVKFSSSASKAQKAAAHSSVGGNPQGEIPLIGWVPVRLPAGMSVEEGLAKYRQDSHVGEVVPNTVYRPSAVPNDPLVSSQYGLLAIDAFRGWEFETGSTNDVTIAVIDTGIDGTHPDLAGKISAGSAAFDPDIGTKTDEPIPTDCMGHGTQVAGIAAALTNNGQGMAGVSWGAKLLSLRVFDGSCAVSDDIGISTAIVYAAIRANTPEYGKMVINLSLGTDVPSCSSVLVNAVNVALSSGVVVVAAAGNKDSAHNPDGVVECPAKIPGVIAVGATDSSNVVASFSARGSSLMVTAPGVKITTTKKGGGYEYDANGTSFASPHVAGLAALLLSSALPTKTTTQIISLITESSDDLGALGKDNDYGWGKINAFKALSLGIKGTVTECTVDKKEEPVAYPNPFKVSTNRCLFFKIPGSIQGSGLEIKIYTMAGEIVRTINTMLWDGKNDSGSPVASGVYIFRAKSNNGSGTGRFALIR